jgi:hypothetical protein
MHVALPSAALGVGEMGCGHCTERVVRQNNRTRGCPWLSFIPVHPAQSAGMHVPNGIPLGRPPSPTVATVNSAQTLEVVAPDTIVST